MRIFIPALIMSVGVECLGALLLGFSDPHDWDTPRSLGFLLHYPAEALLQGMFPLWAVFIVQGFLWYLVFIVALFLWRYFRRKRPNAA